MDAMVRWNEFGTPRSLIRPSGYLASGLPADAETAARRWLNDTRDLFRLSEQDVADLELVNNAPLGDGRAVLLRQRFGSYEAGQDGLVAVAVVGGKIAYVSSSIAGATQITNAAALTARQAFAVAADNVGETFDTNDVRRVRTREGWTHLSVGGLDSSMVRLVALPTPTDGVRLAYETFLFENAAEPLAVTHFVDAQTGEVLLRYSRVDYLDESSPEWRVFPNSPPLDYSSNDTRELWCWDPTDGCQLVLNNTALSAISPVPWDVIPPAATTFTSDGNNARSVENWNSADPFTKGITPATPSPTREYDYGWTNQWYEERCDPAVFTSPQKNDIDAAIANLFAMHNRMHDFAYFLGFTEPNFNLQRDNYGRGGLGNDPEKGNAQAGGIVGGPPGFAARDNANQITGPDGDPFPGTRGGETITNMYLWQPIAGGFYAPCVDGDFDMSVIGHEYTHAISNRMVAGPNVGLSGSASRAMGESWSDLTAVEYLLEYGFAPLAGENPFAVGPYVTGDHITGIRNYGMNESPLNYSDVGYDFACNTNQQGFCVSDTQVHADGEIWSAINYDIRQAMVARYGAGDAALQASCADGLTPVGSCPGNRRWMQLVFDAYLLMATGTPSMLDARDAIIAADATRFGGANADLLWNTFAKQGFGEFAFAADAEDVNPVPSFESPFSNEAAVTFRPTDLEGNPIAGAQLFVGDYEARVTPVADTNAATQLTDTVRLVPGSYNLIARANGFGMKRLTLTVRADQVRDLPANMPANFASTARGATIAGDGIGLTNLIDDTEASTWARLGAPVAGTRVTVRLDPSKPWHEISRIQVSAMLRTRNQNDPAGDTTSQNRFSALRAFEIWTCEVKAAVDCSEDGDFNLVFESDDSAFPAGVPRPTAPDLIMRSFDIPKHKATYVRLVVISNQCTGTPAYAGDQDDDPLNTTDCSAGSAQDENVRAAELQVFQK
jgi:extracellular elastinolytic metalloproteinase